jgi:creatinine amidohydrolase
MIEWSKLTNDEVAGIDRNLPVIIPIGLVEAHGPHLVLGLDIDTAEFFSRKIAEETGAVLAPCIHYGFADAMKEYPGTIGVTAETLSCVVRDISLLFYANGFKKQIYFSGHGANKLGCELGFYKVWEQHPDFKPAYWNWWTEAGVNGIHHADKGETEAAMAVGSPVYMDRVKDYKFRKPWHMVYSRYRFQSESGGINGEPSKADPEEAGRIREQVIRVLSEKVQAAIDDVR